MDFFYCVIAICLAGTYSTNNGVSPCRKCPLDTYQDTEQMTSCKACPAGTDTKYEGSTSIDDCAGEYMGSGITNYG